MGETSAKSEEPIGVVEHYYPRVQAAVVRVERRGFHEGDTLHIVGHGVDFVERITSIEMDHQKIPEARAGQSVGIQVSRPVREKNQVFLVRTAAGPMKSGPSEGWRGRLRRWFGG